MPDKEKVIKGLECCTFILGKRKCNECPYQKDNGCYQLQDDFHALLKEQNGLMLALEQSNAANEYLNAEVERLNGLLKEQEVRELTIDEWREWKNNPKRNPICELWENDTSPMWILNPKDVHEPALLMGKLKLFTGKPTFEQCKAVKWE